MDTLLQDLRYALRSLARSPGFTLVAVATLALGIGAATAGFSLLNWVLLRPLPGVREPGRLGVVWITVRTPGGAYMPNGIGNADRSALLHATPTVSALSGRQGPIDLSFSAVNTTPRNAAAEFVTTDYFRTLGVHPHLGRLFVPEDDSPPMGRPVAVISDRLWHNDFGGRPDIVGQPMHINGLTFTVLGVTSPGFYGTSHFHQAEIWLPGQTSWEVQHVPPMHRPLQVPYYEFVLRLRPGASFTQAEGQLKAAIRTLAVDTSRFSPGVTAEVFPGVGLESMGRDVIGHQLALVMCIAGLVLLVACANVANLLLLHRGQRRADVIVRLALGASRGRLVRHFLTESVLVGAVSGAVGIVISLWIAGLFSHLRLLGFIPVEGIHPDWRVLGFAVGIGMLASTAAGLAPAFFSSRANLGSDLRASAPAHAGGAQLLRTGLSVVQVAVSLTLLAGAFLFARTLQNFARVPLGFDPTGVAILQVYPELQGYSQMRAQVYLRSLADRVAGLPGIAEVAFVSLPPFTGMSRIARVRRSDSPSDAAPLEVATNEVSGAYFATLKIPILSGGAFHSGDEWPDSSRAVGKVILSESLAKRLFGNMDPVGRLLDRDNLPAEVVGVVGDVQWNSRRGPVEPLLYEVVGQPASPYGPMIAIRSALPNATLAREVQDVSRELDASLPINNRGDLGDAVAATLASETLLFRLVGLLSTITLLLTAVGVYSLVAYSVTTRTREFGLRMALGAEARDVLRTAARPAVTIVFGGVACGVVGAVYLTRFIKASLYGVSPLDLTAFVSAAALLCLAVVLASWIPARRAAKVDPMVALRYE